MEQIRVWAVELIGRVLRSVSAITIVGLVVFAPVCSAGTSLCCPGDIDGDGGVSSPDIALVLGAWGDQGSSNPADLDGSGEVSAADVAIVLGSWGACPSPCLQTIVIGRVALQDGTMVSDAAVTTDFGGADVTDDQGAFQILVDVGIEAPSITVSAVALLGGDTYSGTKRVAPIAFDAVTDAGTVTLTADTPCEPEWLGLDADGLGANGSVIAMATFDDGTGPALFVGGAFTSIGDIDANYIAKWDGATWSALSVGVSFWVSALTTFDDGSGTALYAGGYFGSAGGVPVNGIAKWNGRSWAPCGSGVDGIVQALATFDDGSGMGPGLYVSGDFAHAGGVAAANIARWDGRTWSPLGAGINSTGHAMQTFVSGSDALLIVGGSFTQAGGEMANRVAAWNGSAWSALAEGVNGDVFDLAVFDDGNGEAVYVGGFFTSAGGAPANHIARWSGTTWSALGSGVNGLVTAVATFTSDTGTDLYVGGNFTAAGGVPASDVARWNGAAWSALAEGIDGIANVLRPFSDRRGSSLYVGGTFSTAGGVRVNSIARWGCGRGE